MQILSSKLDSSWKRNEANDDDDDEEEEEEEGEEEKNINRIEANTEISLSRKDVGA